MEVDHMNVKQKETEPMERTSRGGKVVAFAAMALICGSVGVMAQGDKEGIIKARRDTMKTMGKSMASVKGYLDGKNDLTQAQEGANTIATTAPKLPEAFVAGTSMTEFPGKTGAKPAIWSENDKFVAAQKQLVSESQKLVDVIKAGDKAKIGEQFASVGKNGCGGCHNTFREKLE
jgi:cytochrome c556